MIVVIDILLFLGFLICCTAIYSFGFHRGVDTIARQELAEQFPDEYPMPKVAGEFVGERREAVKKQVEENLFQIWRKAQKLDDNPTVRAMYGDVEFRKQLEEQKRGN